MHIALIGPSDPREFADDLGVDRRDAPVGLGGSTVNQLVRTLLDLGHRVTLVTASPDVVEPWRASGPALSVAVVRWRSRARQRFLDQYRLERRAMAAELRRVDADVYHAHWTYEYAAAAIGSRRRPLLVTAHDSPWTILRTVPDLYRLGRLVLALRVRTGITELSAVSPYLIERWRHTMGYFRPIRLIPNGVPGLATDPGTRPSGGPPILLEIADGSRRKNVSGLLSAFAIVRRTLPEARLRVAGDGLGEDGELAAEARRSGIDDGVSFLGLCSREQVARELDAATLFVHASVEESQGLSMLEALQSGLPVVAGSDSGGVAWTMLDGKAARLVDVRRPAALAAAILDLLGDEAEQRRLVEAGQAALATRYAPATVAGQYLEVYAELIGSGRR